MIKSKRILKKSLMGENVNKDLLLTLDKPDLLFKVLKENFDNSEVNKNILFRSLYSLSELDTTKALDILKLLNDKFNDISFLALKIKILSAENLIKNALDVLKKIPENKQKKRLLLPIFWALCNANYEDAFRFLNNNIYKKYRLYEEDLLCIYEKIDDKDFNQFMKILSNNEILIENINKIKKIKELKNSKQTTINLKFECNNCKSKLIKFDFNQTKRQDLISNLENEYLKNKKIVMSPLQKRILQNNYNIFIDGNNVLFFIDRKVTLNSFKRLESIFNEASKNGNVLITLHQRHRDFLDKNLSKKESKIAKSILKKLESNIYFTPYKMNDDWFFIWAGITTNNSYVITNDLLRDHINNISEENIISNTLSRWINDYVIRYDFSSTTNVTLTFPYEISIKIQNNDGIWHLPTTDGEWICQNIT